jgi:hypothetical protein
VAFGPLPQHNGTAHTVMMANSSPCAMEEKTSKDKMERGAKAEVVCGRAVSV